MGCLQELHRESLLSNNGFGQWTYQKTGKKSSVVYVKLVAPGWEFKSIPCPDVCFDQIQITGFPQEPFLCSRLFTELNRILRPKGKLCFNPAAQLPNINTTNQKTTFTQADETIIYYGMKNGFSFAMKERPSRKHRSNAKNHGYSLHLTLTDPTVPSTLAPGWTPAKKFGQTLLWFVKELTHEGDPTYES